MNRTLIFSIVAITIGSCNFLPAQSPGNQKTDPVEMNRLNASPANAKYKSNYFQSMPWDLFGSWKGVQDKPAAGPIVETFKNGLAPIPHGTTAPNRLASPIVQSPISQPPIVQAHQGLNQNGLSTRSQQEFPLAPRNQIGELRTQLKSEFANRPNEILEFGVQAPTLLGQQSSTLLQQANGSQESQTLPLSTQTQAQTQAQAQAQQRQFIDQNALTQERFPARSQQLAPENQSKRVWSQEEQLQQPQLVEQNALTQEQFPAPTQQLEPVENQLQNREWIQPETQNSKIVQSQELLPTQQLPKASELSSELPSTNQWAPSKGLLSDSETTLQQSAISEPTQTEAFQTPQRTQALATDTHEAIVPDFPQERLYQSEEGLAKSGLYQENSSETAELDQTHAAPGIPSATTFPAPAITSPAPAITAATPAINALAPATTLKVTDNNALTKLAQPALATQLATQSVSQNKGQSQSTVIPTNQRATLRHQVASTRKASAGYGPFYLLPLLPLVMLGWYAWPVLGGKKRKKESGKLNDRLSASLAGIPGATNSDSKQSSSRQVEMTEKVLTSQEPTKSAPTNETTNLKIASRDQVETFNSICETTDEVRSFDRNKTESTNFASPITAKPSSNGNEIEASNTLQAKTEVNQTSLTENAPSSLAKPEPTKLEGNLKFLSQTKLDPKEIEQVKTRANEASYSKAKTDPSPKLEQAKTEGNEKLRTQTKLDTTETEQVKTSANQANRAEHAMASSTKPELAKPELAKPELAKPELAKPELAKPELAKPKNNDGLQAQTKTKATGDRSSEKTPVNWKSIETQAPEQQQDIQDQTKGATTSSALGRSDSDVKAKTNAETKSTSDSANHNRKSSAEQPARRTANEKLQVAREISEQELVGEELRAGNRKDYTPKIAAKSGVNNNEFGSQDKSNSKLGDLSATPTLANTLNSSRNSYGFDRQESPSLGSDDLTKIHGIGPAASKRLRESGIDSFSKLLNAGPESIKQALTSSGSQFKFSNPLHWTEQAAFAVKGDWNGLAQWQSQFKDESDSQTHELTTSPETRTVGKTSEDESSRYTTGKSYGSTPDDLTKISGIGPATQKVLNQNGIRWFEQIATMEVNQLTNIFADAPNQFQLLNTSTWAQQAQAALQSKPNANPSEEMQLLKEIKSISQSGTSPTSSLEAAQKQKKSHQHSNDA